MWMIGGGWRIPLPGVRREIFVRELIREHSFRRKGNLPLFDFEKPENLKREGDYG